MSAIPGKAPSVKLPPQIDSGSELLLEELGRLLTVEETLAKVLLPELLRELQDAELQKAVDDHLQETRGHAGRVKEAFLAVGAMPAGRPAYGLEGLRVEHKALAPQVVPGARAVVHCAAAMGVEHYEINAYDSALGLAQALGALEVERVLRANLDQEVAALQTLGQHASRLARLAVEERTVSQT
jgi:ferritin-like metal-binding protein YciE